MRLILRAMIASSSLAAFSASVMKAGLGPVQAPVPLRPFAPAPTNAPASPPVLVAPEKPPSPPATAPRGSLLDLTV